MLAASRFVLLAAFAALCGCDPGAGVQHRVEEIQRDNAALDRRFSIRAAQLVRARWLVEGSAWYGKMDDGAVVRLDSPTLEVTPIHVGRPFYTGWAGDVTVSSGIWKSRPETRPRAVFSVRYRATFKDLKTPEIETAEGPKMQRATAADAVNFKAE
jgi:hypothetical protein